MIPNCAATRHLHFTLDGTGPADIASPSIDNWPVINWEPGNDVRKVNLDTLNKEDVTDWQPGETLLLSGTILTGRDAAHKRLQSMLESGDGLPNGVDFNNKFIYYVGPVDAVREQRGRDPNRVRRQSPSDRDRKKSPVVEGHRRLVIVVIDPLQSDAVARSSLKDGTIVVTIADPRLTAAMTAKSSQT